ncbi:MAG: hypothetical protein A2504_10060 [Bdellovibrionales bacterium RIFOXYD12_FULL_39_22]|nr:MAG: hypothetical protein A2385_17695 [Bdellovibrionales bacterium RIFOXYB1_FULL_39_21]OFZ43953.1 MAG: hypothetical protein A2485_04365 [Bdellovibrionales bacterium RIFOXYC12_FULL_39_17]OFZ48325.1 MAG: hypothetical protein A2404_01780 [Bdellovibrionales bacterium RIFOXYC1_FULL_39_130]OFZ73292.1 MAG: hypothetical protein A2451_06060 [Bdellovibrionales bacterium RIFOXYC2_FULL_39_8]OFZ76630.1 MAG: hypothetical protein A2560_17375 [Bdellovibrionales bacterium RIFOXYD1_FULL_39_84]OFZ94916.1 MAG:
MNSNLLSIFIFAFLLILINSCANTRPFLNIDANQKEVDVFAKTAGEKEFKKVGTTPYKVEFNELRKTMNLSKIPMVFEIRKATYITRQFVVVDMGSADMNLYFELEESRDLEEVDRMNKLSSRLFEAQRLIRAKNYNDGTKLLAELAQEYPYASIVYELQGGLYYLKKEMQNALDAFSTALKYDPKNVVAFRMKRFLEAKLNVTRPYQEEKR